MRNVELTSERCAVVYMQRGRVLWANKSAGLNAWIPDGRAVAPNSAASDYFDDGHLEASRVLPAAARFPRETHAKDAPVYEHMTAIPEQAAAFSLLWLPAAYPGDEAWPPPPSQPVSLRFCFREASIDAWTTSGIASIRAIKDSCSSSCSPNCALFF